MKQQKIKKFKLLDWKILSIDEHLVVGENMDWKIKENNNKWFVVVV